MIKGIASSLCKIVNIRLFVIGPQTIRKSKIQPGYRLCAEQLGAENFNGRLSTAPPRTIRELGFDPGRAWSKGYDAHISTRESNWQLSLSPVEEEGDRGRGTKGLEASLDTPWSSLDTSRDPPPCPLGISKFPSLFWMDFKFEWH